MIGHAAGFGLAVAMILPIRSAGASPQAYAHCPGAADLAKADSVSWKEGGGTAIDKHRKLRTSMGVPVPEAGTRILWYASGGDLGTTTFSVVVTRREDGIWHVDGVGQTLVWLPDAKPVDMPRMDRDLSAEDSRSLDAAIADRCLFDGPTFARDPNIVAGGLISSLDVETPKRHWSTGFWGFETPQINAITHLIGDAP